MNNRAVLLYSGGLDSLLAAYIGNSLGLNISALFIETPFYKKDTKKLQEDLNPLNIKLYVEKINNYLEIVKHPRYGYGKHLNPCLDCRIAMFKKAKCLMEELDCSFIITGEVLSQRPFSQRNKANILLIEKKAELEGLVLRPLCAKLLAPTKAEINDILDRRRLFSISGRSRKPQIALTKLFNIEHFESPSGGCLLTEPHFSRRLKNFLELYKGNNFELINMGRHFKINNNLLILARNEREYNALTKYKGIFEFFDCYDNVGACAIFLNPSIPQERLVASGIVLRYSKKAKTILYTNKDKIEKYENVHPIIEEDIKNFIVGE